MPPHRGAPASGRLTGAAGHEPDAPRARLTVRLTPNAGADRIEGVVDGVVRARVAARPVAGAANDALVRLLAGELGLARSRISIVRGASARVKTVLLEGVDVGTLRSRWPGVDV